MLWISELRSSTVEEPVYVYPRHRGMDESCSKSCDASVSLEIDKYVGLRERELVIKRGSGETVRS